MFRELLQDKRIRVVSLVFIIFIVLLFVLYFFFRSDDFRVQSLNSKGDSSLMQLKSGILRAYNGAAFYKTDITSNTPPTILGGGLKLPNLTAAVWADDKGVLLNFDQSLINTAVENYAQTNNLTSNQKEFSTWYFDFSDNTLVHVDDLLIYNNLGYYSSDDQGIYYFSESAHGSRVGNLHFFDTNSKKSTTFESVPSYLEVGTITNCSNEVSVCYTVRKLGNSTEMFLYSVNKEGETKELSKAPGVIYPLTNSKWHLILHNDDDISEEDHGTVANYTKARLKDTITGDEKTIDRNFSLDSFILLPYDKNKFSIVGDSPDHQYATVTRDLFGNPKVSEIAIKTNLGEAFSDAIVINNHQSYGATLFNSSDSTVYVYAKNGYVENNLTPLSVNEILTVSQKCNNQNKREVDYISEEKLFTFYVADNSSFTKRVADISECLNKQPEVLHGYNYSFVSIDPVNGRVTSY